MFKIIDPRKRLLIVAIILIISVVLIGCSSPVVSTEKSVEVLPTNNNLRTAQPVNQATGQAREIESPVRDLSKNSSTPMNGQTPTAEAVPGISPAATPVGQSINSDDGLSRETRAIWSWAGFQATSKEEVDQMVAKVVDRAHLNVILLLVYGEGTAHFEPSHSRFPNSEERLTNQSAFSEDGYHDVLSYLIAIRDERRADDDPTNDFEVQAWFIVNSGGRMEEAWPPIDKTEPYMLNAIFPEFKLKVGAAYQENDDRYAKHDTTVVQEPRFRAYMTDLIAGLVEDYDVDGVHLDYIRTGGICFNNEPLDYPGVEYDYPGCQEDYKAWTRETYDQEYTLWEDTDGFQDIRDEGSGRVASWLEHNVGLLVQSIHDEVKSVKPEAVVSMAALSQIIPEERHNSYQGQVAWEWLDRGWVDAVFVMAYGPNTQWLNDRMQLLRDATQQESSRSRLFPGIVTHDLHNQSDLWSYLIVEQVEATMRGQWTGQPLDPPAKGMALFLEHRLSDEAVELLGQGPFKEPAVPFWGE